MKRITVDLTKASTETLDLTDKINPRVGDGQLAVPLHVIYGTDDSGNEEPVDMRNKDIEFLSQDTNKNDIYVSGTVTTDSKGDDPYSGNVTFVFPEGAFKVAGTYDVNKTMFRIINKADKTVLSTVNVKLNVLEGGGSDYNFDPNKTGYNSRLEDMLKLAQSQLKDKIANTEQEAQAALNDAKQKAAGIIKDASDQAQALLDDIKQTNSEAKGNVAGDTAATAKQAKQLANDNSGKIHDLQGEVGDARGRFMTLSDRENKQDFDIDRKEDKDNANANYAAINLRDDQQDKAIAEKANQSFITDYLSKMYLRPEAFENEASLKAKYPTGKEGIFVTVDTGHKWIYINGEWKDCGVYQAAGVDPNIEKALANTDHDNLLPNPTFKSLDGWNITTTDSTVEPDYSINENGFENSNVLTVNGYGSLLDGKSWTNVVSDPIVVESGQFITFGAMYNSKDQMTNDQQPNVNIELDVLDNSKKVLNKNFVYSAPDTDNDLHSRTRTIKLPGEAGYIQMKFQINGPGSFKVAQPQVNYGLQFVSNSVGQLQKSVQSENLLFDNPVKNWQMVWYTDSKMYLDQFGAVKVVSDSKNVSVLASKLFRQRPGDSLSIELYIQADDRVQLHIIEYDDNLTKQNEQVFLVEKNDKLSNQFFEDIKLGNATTIVQITLTAAPNRSFTVAKAIAKNTGFSEKYDASLKSLVNRNNLINNSSLTSLSGWSLYSTKKGFYPDYRFYSNPDSQDDNVIEINGYGNFNNDDSYVHLKSDPISVKGGKLLSFGSLHNCRTNEGKNTLPNASIKLSVLDVNGSEIKNAFVYYIPDTDDDLHLRQNTVVLPDNASSVVLDFMIVGPGTFKVSEPQINYGPSLNAKVDSEVIRDIKNGDLLADNPVSNWQPIWFTGQKKYADDESTFLTTLDGTATPLQSEYIPVFPGDTFDVQALIKTSGHVYLTLNEYDQNLKQLSVTKIDANQSDDYKIQYFRNLTASSGTAYIAISFAVIGAKSSYNLKKVKLIKTSSLNDNASENVSTNNLLVPKFSITNDLSSLSDDWEKSSFTYEENGRSIKGYLQVGIQGFSSREWRKKNYKVKLYEDADCTKKLKIAFKPSWVPDSHFNLKANFIDATQAHNLVNAKLFANATAVTPIANETTRKGLSESTQLGQMAGFPVELYVNGTYMGLYTLNTKKDDKSFGMDSNNKAHEAIEVNAETDMFNQGQTIDQKNFATILQKQADTNVKAGFDRFIAFLNDATDDDIKAHLQDYVDVKSAMNTWLFGILSQESDIWGRSMLLLTYDGGQHWFVTAYDLDATWGLSWDGKSLDGNAEWFKFENIDSEMHKTGAWYNKLWTRIYDNFKPELKNQYQYLRSNAWSTQALINAYRTYIDAIPDSVYEKDHKRYPDIPSLSTNNFAQIQGKIIERCTNMDAWIDKLA